ncbi:MAG TPA: phosphoribosyltransferase, partial [Stellaceae bacterium]|nr:phosphoribosyltransferase [Stellaceae bacterium]
SVTGGAAARVGGSVTFADFVDRAISILVGLSAILVVAEALGLLPEWASSRLARKRLPQTLAVLREMGLDIDRVKRRNIAASLVEHTPTGDLQTRVREALGPLTLERAVDVGDTERVRAERYIDLMGGTTDPATATIFARHLESFWRRCILDHQADPEFDFIVTPKAGSPILGYEFAKHLSRPFAMHNRPKKFEVKPDDFRAHFDCASAPREHGRALIVDDSSTGGDKVLAFIDDLRRFRYEVSDCLIIFEPGLKEARRKIADKGVRLHTIIKV